MHTLHYNQSLAGEHAATAVGFNPGRIPETSAHVRDLVKMGDSLTFEPGQRPLIDFGRVSVVSSPQPGDTI